MMIWFLDFSDGAYSLDLWVLMQHGRSVDQVVRNGALKMGNLGFAECSALTGSRKPIAHFDDGSCRVTARHPQAIDVHQVAFS